MGAQLPTECARCRTQRLLAFWTFGKFRKGRSDLSGQSLITTLPPDARFPIYTSTEWFSDAWEPPFMEYDPSRSFMKQFGELQAKTPRPHQVGTQNTNSEWCDDVWRSKNCYLCRSLVDCENTMYSYRVFGCRDSADLAYNYNTEQSYDCVYCFRCHKVFYAFNSRDSIDSIFLYDCRNLQNCFMCWNLRNKQYYIQNKPYSKEGYFEKLKEYDMRSRKAVSELKQQFQKLVADQAIHKADFNTRTVRSDGNYLTNCRECHNCYFIEDAENCINNFRGRANKDSCDLTSVMDAEKCLMGCMGDTVYGSNYWLNLIRCRNLEYSDHCIDCEDCFGCVGLRKKQYYVLNKPYAKEQYENLVRKIKEGMTKDGDYGKFFPHKTAYTGYNLSVANLYFRKSGEEVEKFGGLWVEPDDVAQGGMPAESLPDRIDDVPDSITKQALICPKTGYRYNIAPQELAFLKQFGIPAPTLHFDARLVERFKPMTLIDPRTAKCFLCQKEIVTYWPLEWNYKKIACESCYQNEVA